MQRIDARPDLEHARRHDRVNAAIQELQKLVVAPAACDDHIAARAREHLRALGRSELHFQLCTHHTWEGLKGLDKPVTVDAETRKVCVLQEQKLRLFPVDGFNRLHELLLGLVRNLHIKAVHAAVAELVHQADAFFRRRRGDGRDELGATRGCVCRALDERLLFLCAQKPLFTGQAWHQKAADACLACHVDLIGHAVKVEHLVFSFEAGDDRRYNAAQRIECFFHNRSFPK